ncbi:hypothetical protein KKF91_09130, partial [Myxococcota bacterium]|nr:hypothetical protein [Myxococcota bacterium]
PQQIHLFGFSAGAQFAHRYALTHPTQVRAVVAHAPGAVTPPGLFTPTRFLFTVGALDETRLEEPRPFLAAAQSFKIDASLKVFPGLDHRLSLPVLEAARAFFVSTKL